MKSTEYSISEATVPAIKRDNMMIVSDSKSSKSLQYCSVKTVIATVICKDKSSLGSSSFAKFVSLDVPCILIFQG